MAYEYMNEKSINQALICSICQSPFIDPRCVPCDDTFCYKCIKDWIQKGNNSCPLCRANISMDTLSKAPRALRSMLDELAITCIPCKQAGLQRINFDEHLQKFCPKTIVTCPSANINCPWTGQRDQLNQHLVDCPFERMRPMITELLNKNEQLEQKEHQQIEQISDQQDVIARLKNKINQQKAQVTRLQNQNQQLDEEIVGLRRQAHTVQHQTQIEYEPPGIFLRPRLLSQRSNYACWKWCDCNVWCIVIILLSILVISALVGCIVLTFLKKTVLTILLAFAALIFFLIIVIRVMIVWCKS